MKNVCSEYWWGFSWNSILTYSGTRHPCLVRFELNELKYQKIQKSHKLGSCFYWKIFFLVNVARTNIWAPPCILFERQFLLYSDYFFIKNGPIPASFMFIFVFCNSNINWLKHRRRAWELNPGRQDGGRKPIRWAMVAPQIYSNLVLV